MTASAVVPTLQPHPTEKCAFAGFLASSGESRARFAVMRHTRLNRNRLNGLAMADLEAILLTCA
jgi:hypothetical protein